MLWATILHYGRYYQQSGIVASIDVPCW